MSDSLARLSNDVLFGMMAESPDIALALGLGEVDGRALPPAGLPDFSEEGRRRRDAMVAAWAQRLARISTAAANPGVVTPAAAADPGVVTPAQAGAPPIDDVATHQCLRFILERGFQNRFSGAAGFECADHLYPVTHITGVHSVAVEMLARDHPLASLQDTHDYVERLARLPHAIHQARSTLSERRARGFVAPRVVLERAAQDIRGLVQQGSESIFVQRLRDGLKTAVESDADPLLARAVGIVESELRPAYAALLDELQAHIDVGREAIGCGGQRGGGDEFYSWRFTGHTTSSVSPDRAHAIALDELRRLHEELRSLFSALSYSGALPEAFAQLAANDSFPSGEAGRHEVIDVTRSTVAAAKVMMRPLFNLWPAADVIVEPIAVEHEKSMHSTYVPPHPASGKEGVFWINLAQSASQPRCELAVVSHHEAWPGHHLQLTLAQEAAPSPLRRALLFNAYLEGWAKYAEALPVETGLVRDPLARIAALRSELYSTATLALDTGVHVMGWTVDEASRFFVDQTGANPRLAEMIVYRSIAEPAQLCSYKVGLLTVRKLRQAFEKERGAAFRIQDFHDALLSPGALPLDVLEKTLRA